MTQWLEVDHLSWARRSDDQVSVCLALPDTASASGLTEVELADAADTSRRLSARAEVATGEAGVVVSFSVPHSSLSGSMWQLAGRSSSTGGSVPIEARLLAPPGAPVALLPGPTPHTRLRPPPPRRSRVMAVSSRVARRLPSPARTALLAARERGRELVRRRRR
jgi:hypothetical protein